MWQALGLAAISSESNVQPIRVLHVVEESQRLETTAKDDLQSPEPCVSGAFDKKTRRRKRTRMTARQQCLWGLASF
jgi:hypothetical protein